MSRTHKIDSSGTAPRGLTSRHALAPCFGLVGLALWGLVGCSDAQDASGTSGAGAVTGAGAGATGGVPGAGGASAGSTNSGGTAGSVSSSGGTGNVATAGGAGGATGGAGGSAGGASGGGGGTNGGMDHCVYGFSPDPRDANLTGEPAEWGTSEIDLVMPPEVLEWLGERVWEESHDAWHNVRRCGGGGIGGSAICTEHPELVAAHKECADAEDGYQFLVMHRHMMQSLRQAFPNGAALFEGFPSFPFDAEDVPEQWRGRWGTGWSQEIIQFAQKMEDIENHLGDYATEGDLGKAIQCGGGANGATSIHGALHFKWVVNASPHSLGKQTVNIDNYMFWKLHGWIDNIWERYRVAKGLTPDEPKLLDALEDQCREMHALGLTFDPSIGEDPTAPLPEEHGYFHENVRPIMEKYCSGCHSEASPDANMSLGGHITSAKIVENLVGVNSLHGGQFKRVVAGQPNQSWFFLKPAGQAASAGCTGAMCNAQVMPPTGNVTLTTAELDIIKKWITDGAPAPTQ